VQHVLPTEPYQKNGKSGVWAGLLRVEGWGSPAALAAGAGSTSITEKKARFVKKIKGGRKEKREKFGT